MKGLAPVLLVVLVCSCRTTQDLIPPGPGLIGSWQYIERGYSPGFGYIVDQIPGKPIQRIDFSGDGQVRVMNLSDGSFNQARMYRIDSTQYGPRITLFDGVGKPINQSMAVSFRHDTLRLSPSCYEGCHYGFVRLR